MMRREKMAKRFFIPLYGPDSISLRHGLEWLLDQNNSLILYVSILEHLRTESFTSKNVCNGVRYVGTEFGFTLFFRSIT